jgi:SpoVK/Ycf46/Vps4 family AAA+-type ATPase
MSKSASRSCAHTHAPSRTAADVDWSAVARATELLTGADLSALIANATLAAARDEPIGGAAASVSAVTVSDERERTPAELIARNAAVIEGETSSSSSSVDKRLPAMIVSRRHLLEAIESTRASMSANERARLEAQYAHFRNGNSLVEVGVRQMHK